MVDFIKKAIKHPGAFTAKAKEDNESVAGEIKKDLKPGADVDPTTRRQAVLARTLRSFKH